MPTYRITDPDSGRVYRVTGDSPPTEAEIEEIVASQQNAPDMREQFMREEMQKLAAEQGPLTAAAISAGRGMTSIGRGLGFIGQPTESEQMAIEALREERPVATTVGEIAGQTAPFLLPGTAVGAIPQIGGRVAAATGLGALEGGTIARGEGGGLEETIMAGGLGGAVAGVAELVFPHISRIGGKIIRRVLGKEPAGAVIDAAGRPTAELQEALASEGLRFEDLVDEAVAEIGKTRPGASAEQIARRARFTQEGIPISKGELTQEFAQQATEQRLIESAADPLAERFRQFKLKQSDAVRRALESGVDTAKMREETGEAIVDALAGRRNLLRTTKNSLYEEAAENAKNVGGIPLFSDSIARVVPDVEDMEDLAITAPQAMKSLDDLLVQWGLKEPTAAMTERGFQPRQLTVENFERFRKSLNAIERGDQTGASSVAISKIKSALDDEVDNIADVLEMKGASPSIIKPLKEARKTVRQMKQEFSPQSVSGRLIDVKRDGITPVIEASQVYSKMAAKSQPVENVRRLMTSLKQSGEKGAQAISDMQTSVMLDLIDAGFGTASRKIDGINVFNPGAFKKRIKDIGYDKLKAIFKDNPQMLGRIRNIDRISADLIPPSGATPKGSANVIMDLMNRLGVISISSKVPGGGIFVEAMQKMSESGATRKAVESAINASPQIAPVLSEIDRTFPGIAKAMGTDVFRATTPALAAGAFTQEQQ